MGFVEKTRQFLKSAPQSPQRALSSRPAGKEKKYTRYEFRGLLKGAWKNSKLPQPERVGLEKSLFPWQRYGSQISEKHIKGVLQKLRKDEYWAKDFKEKERLGKQRKTLEETTGLKGKY